MTALQRPSIPRLIGWLLVAWALTISHLFALTLVVVEAAVLAAILLRQEAPRLKRGLAGVLLLLALLPAVSWLLLAPGMSATVSVAATIADPEDWSYLDRLSQVWKDLAFGNVLWQSFRARLSVVLAPLFLCGAFVLLAMPRFSLFDAPRIRPSSLAWLLLGSATLATLLAVFVLPMLPTAALMIFLPLLLITAAVGGVYLWKTVPLAGLAALLLALGLAVTGLITYAGDDYAKSDYRMMAAFLNVRQGTEDGVLLMAPSQHFLADAYLLDKAPQLVPLVTPSSYWPERFPQLVPHEVDGQIQDALAAHPALWLVLHDEDSVDPGRFLQPDLTAVAYRDNCIEWRDVEICRYVSPAFLEHSTRQAIDAFYGQTLRLETIDLATESSSILGVPAILAELHWVAEAQPSIDYKVSLRLLNEAGEPVAQRDDFPIGPLLPPSVWGAGDEKPGYMALPLPEDLPAGSYDLQVVVYNPNDMTITIHEISRWRNE